MNNLETAVQMLQKYIVDDFDWMYVEGAMGHNYDLRGDVKCVLNEIKRLTTYSSQLLLMVERQNECKVYH
jgi:hypothetical protein